MIDLLESRLHLSLSFALDAGTLTLGGTPAADVILICKVPPTASDPESLSVKINSSTFYLPLSEVERITIKTGSSNPAAQKWRATPPVLPSCLALESKNSS